jgi:hypothetical protein
MANDYLPRREAELIEWSQKFVNYASLYAPSWGVPPQSMSALTELQASYVTNYEKARDPNHGKVDIFEKDEARKYFVSDVRGFVRTYIANNPLVSDVDKENLGVHIHKPHPTPIPPPTTYPDCEVDTSMLRHLMIHFRDHNKDVKAKPYGIHGAEICWEILDVPPTRVEDLRRSSFSTNSPMKLQFDETQRGKRLYFCIRWENTKGEKGPWGEILSAIIP